MHECYQCSGQECAHNLTELNTCTTNYSCFVSTKIHEIEEFGSGQVHIFERGCDHAGSRAHKSMSMCEVYRNTKEGIFTDIHYNCCQTDKCNGGDFHILPLDRPYVRPMQSSSLAMVIGSLALLAIASFIIFLIYRKRKQSAKNNNDDYELGEANDHMDYGDFDYDSSPKISKKQQKNNRAIECMATAEETEDLSSRGGGPNMLERTLAKDIVLETEIGSGRYGLVYKAKWKYDVVAVKTFLAREYASYDQERKIYDSMNVSMSPYILNYHATDMPPNLHDYTEHWIITEYCPLGSLFDYLSNRTLTIEEGRLIIDSIISGFAYLHKDMYLSSNKPQIAHRDIKSKNILMRKPTLCVIADFGLAVTHYNGGELKVPVNYKVGTRRYMAPEILNETFKNSRFSSYLNSDIYSIALVLWEVINRVEHLPHIPAKPFRVAYEGMVPQDPSFDDMLDAVFTKNLRPPIDPALRTNDFLNTMITMIEESWKGNPSSRFTIVTMKSRIEPFGPLL